jgi:nucleoside-diphosphate-sugar epimerase
MSHHVIVGAGAVGTHTALELVNRGHQVTVVTRSGSGPTHENIELTQLDATDAHHLTAISRGAVAVYNCASPPYHRWATDWPPLSDSLISTAEATGAGLVSMGNLYSYGRVHEPITEQTPERTTGIKGNIRKQMWADALTAHQQGRIRATEARASDFFGAGTTKTSYLSISVFPKVLSGKTIRMPVGDLDAPHSWTYVPDVARTLVTLGTDDRSWGQLWNVPTSPARSIRQVAADAAAVAHKATPKATVLPRLAIKAAGLVVPFAREMGETRHQFDYPFILDSSKTEREFALAPTPWAQALAAALAA